MAVRVLDYSALTEPVARADVAAWRTRVRASGAPWARTATSTGWVIAAVVVGLILLLSFGSVLGQMFRQAISAGSVRGLLFPTAFLVVIVIVGVTVWRRRASRGGWDQWYRLTRFAEANGMSFTPAQGMPSYPGEIFGLGRDQAVLSHLTTTSGHFLDLGNYRYVTGSGRSSTTHNWGFMALSLDRAMPNIVLDSKANNTFFGSNLPAVLDRKQVLHLEGDFDTYFTLYCPQEYEQDALYIFTPDLMALLIDEASPFDVELVDRWMFVYSSKTFDMVDPTTLKRLFTIADTVGAKTLNQTEHYADDRIGDRSINMVAPQGARLRRGVSVIGIIAIVAIAAFWGWSAFSGLFAN
jgi:hypothetical protein